MRVLTYRRLLWALFYISWMERCDGSWSSRQPHNLKLPHDYNSQKDLVCHIFVECLSKHDGIQVDRRALMDSKFDCKIVDSIEGDSIQYALHPLRQIELPADFRRANTDALVKGQWYVLVRNGKLDLGSLSSVTAILYPSMKSVSTIPFTGEPTSRKSLEVAGRSMAASVDVHKTLVVRVSTKDSEPTLLAEEMKGIIFNATAPSLLTQPYWCSGGKIQFQPSSHGVLDVEVDMKAEGTEADKVANAANTAAKAALGLEKLEDEFDHVLFCLPPGTANSWIAYASINYWRSVYNDLWCTYISGYMHELGHNIGFYHSNLNEFAYGDSSGYMGAGYAQNTWPQKCYNGQNNWLMGWFQDRALDLPPLAPKIYRLATFVDYQKASSDIVLIRVDQALYLQYNRAKSFNKDTQEGINKVTVVEYIPVVFPGTQLVASLGNATKPLQHTVNGTNHTFVIDVCKFISGDSDQADVAIVSIGIGFSLCYEYNKQLATVAPISPVYLQSPSLSPIYFRPSPDITEDFPTVTYDGERTPRLHRRPQVPRIFGGPKSSGAASLKRALLFGGSLAWLIGFLLI